ncbi:hypothetical protein V8G54_036460 [Vigna mungo]|uniref:Zinc finger PHD-type domain-containing protein n=1 Tax=Vigna mungo TaxID=3915 RepID=A0AAQ3MGT3_VIGMU
MQDEMGLGKTVELLACIFTHPRSASGSDILFDLEPQINGDQKVTLKRVKRDRVECICGAVSESLKYEGLWVQCDICDAWQHADCVGTLSSQLCLREYTGGGFAWMRHKWWKVVLQLPLKWL